MSVITRTLVLVGAYAGQTVALKAGGTTFEFEDGKIEVSGPDTDVENLSKFLRNNYQAYPEGSKELEEAQAAIEEAMAHEDAVDEGSAGADSEHPGGSDDPDGGAGEGTDTGTEAADGGGDVQAGEGSEGLQAPAGDGQSPIAEALNKLDPEDDEAWTADGKPKMSAVEAALGRTDVTRAQVDAAVPGFNREVARGDG